MFIDLETLLVMAFFASAMSAALLAYAWFLHRHATAIALWAIAYLVGAASLIGCLEKALDGAVKQSAHLEPIL